MRQRTRRWLVAVCGGMLALASAVGIPLLAAGTTPASADATPNVAATQTPIKHLVVIFQ